jgi:hypothetical protein
VTSEINRMRMSILIHLHCCCCCGRWWDQVIARNTHHSGIKRSIECRKRNIQAVKQKNTQRNTRLQGTSEWHLNINSKGTMTDEEAPPTCSFSSHSLLRSPKFFLVSSSCAAILFFVSSQAGKGRYTGRGAGSPAIRAASAFFAFFL